MEKTPIETCFFSSQICAQCALKGGMSEKTCFPWLYLNWLPQWNPVIQMILIWPQYLGASQGMPFSIIDHGSELGCTGDWVQILEVFCKCWLQHLNQASSSCPGTMHQSQGAWASSTISFAGIGAPIPSSWSPLLTFSKVFWYARKIKEDEESTGCPSGLSWHGSLVPSTLRIICLHFYLGWRLCWQVNRSPCAPQASWTAGSACQQQVTYRGTAAPDGSSQQIHQHRSRLFLPKFTRGPILTSVLYFLKHTEVTKVGVWCNWRENLLSRILFKSRCWKLTVSFCFVSPVCVYYFSWPKHWSSPL